VYEGGHGFNISIKPIFQYSLIVVVLFLGSYLFVRKGCHFLNLFLTAHTREEETTAREYVRKETDKNIIQN